MLKIAIGIAICCSETHSSSLHLTHVCRRISNRESARRLRKQRSEKLHNLTAQQNSLAGLSDGLKLQIGAQRAKLTALHSLNDGLHMRLRVQVSHSRAFYALVKFVDGWL